MPIARAQEGQQHRKTPFYMALDKRFSRLLTQDDFDLLNTQYTLDLDYTSAADYRRAQVIWNLHAKCESLADQLKQKETEGKRLN